MSSDDERKEEAVATPEGEEVAEATPDANESDGKSDSGSGGAKEAVKDDEEEKKEEEDAKEEDAKEENKEEQKEEEVKEEEEKEEEKKEEEEVKEEEKKEEAKEEEKKEEEKEEEEEVKEEEKKEEAEEEKKEEGGKKEEAQPSSSSAAASSSSSSSAASSSSSSSKPIACDGSGEGVHWTTDPAGHVPIKMSKEGPGASEPLTVMKTLEDIAKANPDKVALREKKGEDTKFTEYTYKQYRDMVLQMARALLKVGVRAHSGVSILGFNSVEWFVADLAAIHAGALAAGVYTTNGPEACHYILEHCDAEVCFVQNEMQLKKILEIKDRLPKLKKIVQWQGDVPADAGDDVLSWDAMMALGEGDEMADTLAERMSAQLPGQCSTLIYTSGTTGNPKAVMISHDNVTWTARTVAEKLNIGNTAEIVSYLPLSHIAAQMVDIHAPIAKGCTVSFARADALKGTLGDTLKEVRPTVFLGVPRVWEKIAEKMKAIGAKTTGVKKMISGWAKKKGLEGGYAEQEGKSKGMMFGLANTLVFSKVRQALGLDRCTIQCTAAAPISKETLEYFLSIGIPIFEVYGMSECTGPQTVSYPKNYKTGSCGRRLEGTELELADPDAEGNGEICFRGRHIFIGYLKNPEATGQTIDANGFLHSGDVGALDSAGFLRITGRIKELIITAGGENIPPVLIENSLKASVPFISNVMVIGDKRKFLSCVVTLHTAVDADGEPTDELAGATLAKIKEIGSSAKTVEEAIKDEAFNKAITEGITAANKNATSNAQRVQKFKILPVEFSVTGGELTATQKLKRRIVNNKYGDLIESMYA